MISLKRHIDSYSADKKKKSEDVREATSVDAPNGSEAEAVSSAYYRDLVAAVVASATRACPAVSDDFQNVLRPLRELLLAHPTQIHLDAARGVEREVGAWGIRTCEYYGQKTAEIREMMLAMMDAAKTVGDRDEQYSSQFQDVSTRLQSIGNLEDLTEIRHLVNQSASDLRSCAERMVEDGAQSIAGLRAQLASYEKRVVETQKLAETDVLTGLSNRAGVEQAIDRRIHSARKFAVVICDLNGFKELNDLHGHLVGDELLKQFGQELRAQFRPTDLIGRWGGDEFVVVLDETDPAGIAARVETIRKWTFGDYTIRLSAKPLKVNLTAAVGVAAWHSGMTAADVFHQADQAMYADKVQSKDESKARLGEVVA